MSEQSVAATRLYRAIEDLSLPAASRIVVAVSGGPDSVALLLALSKLSRNNSRNWALKVGHINHGLRDPAADEDQAFVVELGQELGIPTEVVRVELGEKASSIESRARELRYRALWSLVDAWSGDFLAVGHTADDQVETLLMNILRGTGSRGLAGMRAKSDRLIRPFLTVSRADIMQALGDFRADYTIDSSNSDRRHLRNRLRAEILPGLLAGHPDALNKIVRAAEIRSRDVDYLEHEADKMLELTHLRDEQTGFVGSSGIINVLDPALRTHAIHRLLTRLLGDADRVDSETTERVIDAIREGRELSLPGGFDLRMRGETFQITKRSPSPPFEPVELEVPGEALTPSGMVRVQRLEDWDQYRESALVVAGPLVAFCDARAVGNRLRVRAWRPGDRMRPLGLGGSRKLQDIFVDRKVPREMRQEVPVVERNGRIIWAAGLALDEGSAATPASDRVVRLLFEPLDPAYRDKMPG